MKQIVVNMAPADVKKEGSGFDLPIAIGILLSTETIQVENIERYMFVGELSLDGSIQPVKGMLPIAIKAREMGYEGLFVPEDNVREAAVVNKLKVYGIKHIQDVIGFLSGTTLLEPTIINTREEFYANQSSFDFDFDEVKGQENVKRWQKVWKLLRYIVWQENSINRHHSSPSVHSAHLITPSLMWLWLVEAPISCLAKSVWHIMGFCFLMNSQSSQNQSLRPCANHLKTGLSPSQEPSIISQCLARLCW